MEKSFLLARSNIRKAKGQTAAMILLILVAAVMLNLWLMLSMDYTQNFERNHDRLNDGHVTLAVDGDFIEMREFLTQTLEADPRTAGFSLDASMHMVCSFDYNGGKVNQEMVILEKETALARQVGKVELVEEGSLFSGIYLPLIYKSDDIDVGKEIEIMIGSNPVTYTVCGFFNNLMAGSHNCGMIDLVLTKDKYSELEESGYAPEAVLCSVRLQDKNESESYEAELKEAVSSRYPAARTLGNSYALVSKSRYISQMICSGVISVMALFILLIALVVMASNIANYIQENMKNLGALKAVGYTGRQLIFSLLLQFLGLAMLAAVTGAGLSYTLFPFINTMMISQTGIPYEVHFLPLPFVLTLLILGGAVFVTIWFSSRRIQKVEPIVALRQGIQTHNFKKNHIPLERTRAPLNLALALKTTFSGKKHNVTVCITVLLLSLVVVFSGLMTRNVIMDMDLFVDMIVGETSDSCINVNKDMEEAFRREVTADRRVEKIYLYHSTEVRHKDGDSLLTMVSDDFAKLNNQAFIFGGRFPKYDNEIAIAAKYAQERDLKVGNEITITADGKEAAYIITGFTQTTNNLGKDCLLTREGYEKLGELENLTYNLNLTDGTDIDAFNLEIKERYGSRVNTTINVQEIIEGTASVYVSLMTIIVIAILILSVMVIVFVLYLLVRTMLGNKKRDYGILKALGFTTGQLVRQTALTFMPAVILSSIAGVTISSLIINPLMALFFQNIGIVKCSFVIPAGFLVIGGGCLILFTFAAACLMSLKVRKITPKALLDGE